MKDIKLNELNANMFVPKEQLFKENHQNKKQIKFLTKKTIRFRSKRIKIKTIPDIIKSNEGRWTKEEHDKFIDGIAQYGCNWTKVDPLIKTRKISQVRSHGQKVFNKLKLCKDESLGIDFTSDSICNFKDMINHIKSVNNNYNIKNIFKYLDNKFDKNEEKDINLFQNTENEQKDNFGDICIDINNNNNIYNKIFNQNKNNEINEFNNNIQKINLNEYLNNNINTINFENFKNVLSIDLLISSLKNELLMKSLNNNSNFLNTFLTNLNIDILFLLSLLRINNNLKILNDFNYFNNINSNNYRYDINNNLNNLNYNGLNNQNNNLNINDYFYNKLENNLNNQRLGNKDYNLNDPFSNNVIQNIMNNNMFNNNINLNANNYSINSDILLNNNPLINNLINLNLNMINNVNGDNLSNNK